MNYDEDFLPSTPASHDQNMRDIELRIERMREDAAARTRKSKEKIIAAVEEMSRLALSLDDAMHDPAYADRTLGRQAHLLDVMFFSVMKRYADGDYDDEHTGAPDDKPLIFAMTVQKQCVDTLKALSAINYMKAIGLNSSMLPPLPMPLPPPGPPDHDEQTIKRHE